jgi:hypothetical protein
MEVVALEEGLPVADILPEERVFFEIWPEGPNDAAAHTIGCVP